MYVCPMCKNKFSKEDLEFVRCTYCGSKVLFKETAPTVKTLNTD